MRQVDLRLDFDCCRCGGPVQVTVRCSGSGLAETTATVSVPCPECSFVNQLWFEPDGAVRSVAPAYRGPYPVPAPSAN